MISNCICSKKSKFKKFIEYKDDVFLKKHKGVVIGRCEKCSVLKTFATHGDFNPRQSHVDLYEKNINKFIEIFEPIVENIIKYKSKGKVLDVGCSSGIMLELLKKKEFSVWGVEPNKQAYLTAREKLGEEIFYGTLQDFLSKDSQQFDIIIYNHVLEHIEDINKEMELIKKALKRGGLLVIGVPNIDNIIFYLRQKYWESLMPKEHLWHFSKSYLTKYLEANGFEILNLSYTNHIRKDYSLIKKIYFGFLCWINRFLNTGEAVLVISRLRGRT